MERSELAELIAEFSRKQEADDRAEAMAMAAAGPWPRWRCRLNWHKPVAARSGTVRGFGFVTRYTCAGECGAYWLEDAFGRDRQR